MLSYLKIQLIKNIHFMRIINYNKNIYLKTLLTKTIITNP